MGQLPPQPPLPVVIDFQDIESGLGFVSFFAASTSLAAGTEFILSDTAVFSSDIEIVRGAAGQTIMTFDSSPLVMPRTAKGTALFSCAIGADGTDNNVSVGVQLQKWDGSSATNLSAEITSAVYVITATGERMVLLQLPLTETHIAEGEQLRLIVKFNGGGGAGSTAIGIDPRGRAGGILDGTNVSTVMEVQIPFKIE